MIILHLFYLKYFVYIFHHNQINICYILLYIVPLRVILFLRFQISRYNISYLNLLFLGNIMKIMYYHYFRVMYNIKYQ